MRKIIPIIGMAIALVEIGYSFYTMNDTGRFFGFELNIWVFRIIWAALFGLMLNNYLKARKATV
ncbi:hypothetical protein Q2T41_09300 [Maribacter confluentis]|uniref:DUF3995 domain-containing protein n=2 Tax=Maribacter confluentis TaxID=1656093 RepID=A0ABT8RR36_9FLAO|nr:hypothetical protein [Maribacter confluentis]MDO1512849.1 hypothetical protein [Maribacter confluentis]